MESPKATAETPGSHPGGRGVLPDCLYCGGTSYDPLFERVQDRLRYVPGWWAFLRCRGCGSAILSPHPKASELAAFYPPLYGFRPDIGRAGSLQRLLASIEYRLLYRPQYAAQTRRVLRGIQLRERAGRRLLDVGCGYGLRLLAFRRRGFDVQGMDFQPEVVDYVRKQLGVAAVCTPIEGLSGCFPSGSFDLVTAFFILEHVPDVRVLLRSCLELLAPGGWLVGAVPLVDSWQARVFKSRWAGVTEAPRHVSLPSQAGLIRVCRQVGFTRVTIRPDASVACASLIGLSLLPGATAHRSYAGGRWWPLLTRLAASGLSLLSLPWCWVENFVLKLPAQGMVFAQKPARTG